jgi:hypothetical protein
VNCRCGTIRPRLRSTRNNNKNVRRHLPKQECRVRDLEILLLVPLSHKSMPIRVRIPTEKMTTIAINWSVVKWRVANPSARSTGLCLKHD